MKNRTQRVPTISKNGRFTPLFPHRVVSTIVTASLSYVYTSLPFNSGLGLPDAPEASGACQWPARP